MMKAGDRTDYFMTGDEDEPVLMGISDGKVGSDGLGTCEHCHDLSEGVKWYTFEGTYWCETCVECL